MKDHPVLDFTEVDLPKGITKAKVTAWSKLKGPRRTLDKSYGENQWGVSEVVRYIQQRERVKNGAKKKRPAYVLKSHEQKVEKYLEHFENPTPNDLQSIRAMVDLEVQMFEVNGKRKQTESAQELRALAEIYTTLSREHRQLQVSLGIDRTNRETALDTANEIRRFVGEAKEFLEKETITIRCDHCRSRLDMGYILFHFRQDVPYEFKFRCPRQECGQTTLITGDRLFEGPLQDRVRERATLSGGDGRVDGEPDREGSPGGVSLPQGDRL